MDWGMLGYFVGDVVQEHIPVVVGSFATPEIVRLKHFGARPLHRAVSRCITLSMRHRKPNRRTWRLVRTGRSSDSRAANPNSDRYTIGSTPTRATRTSTT